MSLLAPTLQAFFTERLITQRDSSPRTVAAYRDTFRLLLSFAHERIGKQPCELDIDDLDAPLIGAFLTHLEHDRGNSARTRNARLAAIHSLYRYTALRHPEHLQTIGRVIAIPFKRHEQNSVNYLNLDEIKALLRAPDRTTWLGRRDHALLLTAIQTGVRVTELVTLNISNVSLDTGAHLQVLGKNRKRRTASLTHETVVVLREWLKERHGEPEEPMFPTRQGRPLTRSGVGQLLAKHTATATVACASLKTKNVSPHTLRHYVDGWVMWPAGRFRWWAWRWGRFRPHNPRGYRQIWSSHSRRSWSAVQLSRGSGVSDWWALSMALRLLSASARA